MMISDDLCELLDKYLILGTWLLFCYIVFSLPCFNKIFKHFNP